MAEFYLYRPPKYVLDYINSEQEKNVIVQFIDDTTSMYAVTGALTKQTVNEWGKAPKSVVITATANDENVTSIAQGAF